jgi:hypothetical protein
VPGQRPVESHSATLERELVHDERHGTREQATSGIFEHVEGCPNRVRRHPPPGCVSTAEFVRAHDPKRQ